VIHTSEAGAGLSFSEAAIIIVIWK